MRRTGVLLVVLIVLLSAGGRALPEDDVVPADVVPADVAAQIRRLESPEAIERYRAVEALIGLGAKAKDAIPALIKALGDPEPGVRVKAIEALGKTGSPQPEDLLSLAAHLLAEDPDVRRAAQFALWKIGVPSASALIKGLADEDVKVRQACAQAIGRFGPRVPRRVREQMYLALGKALKADPEASVRAEAGYAVARLESTGTDDALPLPMPEATLRALVDGLGDKVAEVRLAAAMGLQPSNMGITGEGYAEDTPSWAKMSSFGVALPSWAERPGAEEAVLAIAQGLEDEDARVRAKVASVLGGGLQSSTIPAGTAKSVRKRLLRSIEDDDPRVRRSTARALAGVLQLGGVGRRVPAHVKKAMRSLTTCLEDPDVLLRIEAAIALSRIKPDSKNLVPVLVAAAEESDADLSRTAIVALCGVAGHMDFHMRAKEAQERMNRRFRRKGAKSPPKARPPDPLRASFAPAVPALIEALRDKYQPVRLAAVQALGHIGLAARDAIPALTVVMNDKDSGVQFYAKTAIDDIRSD